VGMFKQGKTANIIKKKMQLALRNIAIDKIREKQNDFDVKSLRSRDSSQY